MPRPSHLASGVALALALTASLVPAAPINANSFMSSSWTASVNGDSPSSGNASPSLGSTPLSTNDQEILNLLLVAENLEANLYREGLTKFSNAADYDSQFPQFKGRNLFDILTLLGAQENDHRVLINEALRETDSEAILGDDLLVNAKEFDYGHALDSIESWVSTIATIEGGGASGYLTALSGFENEALRKAASAIATIEARHNTILRYLFSLAPAPVSEDAAISPADVLTLLGGLIDPTLLKDLAFSPHPTLNASVTNATMGESVSFAPPANATGQLWCAWLSELVPEFSEFSSSNNSCIVPTSDFLGGQTYTAIVKTKSFTDDAIVAGPTVIQLPQATGFAKFPMQFTAQGSVLNDNEPSELQITGSLDDTDVEIANLLLTAENLESTIYNEGVTKFNNDADYQKIYNFPGILKVLTAFGSHENDHRVQFSKVLDAAGDGAKKVFEDQDNSKFFKLDAVTSSIQSFIETIGQIEGGGAAGFEGAVGAIKNPSFRQAAAQIMTIEARHNAFLRFLQKQAPSPNDEEAAITPADVLTLVGGLIDPSILSKLAFKAHTSLNVTTAPADAKQGAWLKFAGVDLKGTKQAYCGFLSMLEPQFSPYYSSNSTCQIPTSHQLGGQTYTVILKDKVYDDDHIIAGPAIVELGAETPVAPFP